MNRTWAYRYLKQSFRDTAKTPRVFTKNANKRPNTFKSLKLRRALKFMPRESLFHRILVGFVVFILFLPLILLVTYVIITTKAWEKLGLLFLLVFGPGIAIVIIHTIFAMLFSKKDNDELMDLKEE